MKIGEKTFVSLSYTLKVAGEVADKSPEGQPLQFIFGTGMLLPKFEEHIKGLGKGDKFEFTLTPADGYGETIQEAVIELPQSAFMVDGKVEDGLLTIGNQIPMSTQDGRPMLGVVTAVGAESATLDFNHPMAGKTLDFTGRIEDVREATEEDMKMFQPQDGCSCGCEGDCDDDCSCGCNG